MNIKDIFNNLALKCFFYVKSKSEKEYINKVKKVNDIKNKSVEGEEAFLRKWSRLASDVDVKYYRIFSTFISQNRENIYSGNLSVEYIEPILNPIKYRAVFADKNIYGKLFPKEFLPKTYLRKVNGLFYDEDYNFIQNINNEKINEILKAVESFIIKPSVESDSGRGVLLFRRNGDNFYDQNNNIFILERINKEYGKDFLLQSCIVQSKFTSLFNKSSVNTLRMVVYRSVVNNKCYVTNAVFRIGALNSVVDNAHGGGKSCGIDKNGYLGKYVMGVYCDKYETFNGINFKTGHYIIPNYQKIKDFAIEVSKRIPYHRLIALDIALDIDNNPILIEYNIAGFAYWIFQQHGQITLDGFTDEIIDYCSNYNNYCKTIIKIQ